MNLTNARNHLDLARKQWDNAATDSWEPEEPASCVTSVFYAYENVVVALAEVFDIKWKKNHYDKADIAAQLAKDGKLSKDISQLMLPLNGLRKDVYPGCYHRLLYPGRQKGCHLETTWAAQLRPVREFDISRSHRS